MRKFALHASSIYNIDFAAIPFAARQFGGIELDVFLNSSVKISHNKNHRQFESRLALPSLKWKMDNNNDWRLIHYPVELLDSYPGQSFESLKQSYLHLIPQKRHEIESFFDGLKSIYLKSLNNLDFYQKMISFSISNVIEKIVISTTLLNEIYNLNNPKTNTKILKCLKYIFGTQGEQKLNIGGRIEFKGEYNLELKKYHIKNTTLIINKKEGEILIELSKLFKSIKSQKTLVRFHGMIELLYINYHGHSLHLPSYCQINKDMDLNCPNFFYEFITPMSNNDLTRAETKKLNPLGYNLSDFDFQLYKTILSSILQEQIVSDDELTDWINLYNYYPRSNEKASADQNPSAKHFEKNIKNIKIKLHNNEFEILDLLNLEKKSIYQLGDVLTQSFSLFRNIIEAMHVPDRFENNLFKFIESKHPNFLNIQMNDVIDYVTLIIRKLDNNGLKKELSNEILKDLDSCHISNFTEFITIDNYKEQEGLILRLMSVIRKVALQYYKFIAFLQSTLFKSNIFLLSMIYDKNDLNLRVEKILENRKEICFKHDPKFILTI